MQRKKIDVQLSEKSIKLCLKKILRLLNKLHKFIIKHKRQKSYIARYTLKSNNVKIKMLLSGRVKLTERKSINDLRAEK